MEKRGGKIQELRRVDGPIGREARPDAAAIKRAKFKSGDEFIALLKTFMTKFPKDHMFGVEIRIRNRLDARFADALRKVRSNITKPIEMTATLSRRKRR